MSGTQMTFADDSAEYKAFVDKFKPKKTTDDCYTPEIIYDTVAEWVSEEYGIDRADMVRPFWPNGDYQRFEYPDDCCVVDNPPFSILSEIKRFYLERGIHFFLFAPELTVFSGLWDERQCYFTMNSVITYENGANVQTSFVTDLDETWLVRTAPDLCERVNEANRKNLQETKKQQAKYVYPDEVLTAARGAYMSRYGVDLRIRKGEAVRITAMDAQRPHGKGIFGSGLLLSKRAAAERAAAERAAATKWQLSERERKMVEMLARKDGACHV